MTPADWSIVNRVPVFRSMGEALSHRTVRNYARGELLFQQGDPATCCYLVLDGWVKLYRQTADGDEVVVSLFTAGESFAEAMMFRGSRYPATAEAVTSVRLLHIDGQLLRDAILRDPQLSFDMLAASSLHLRRLVEQVEQLKAQSAPKRIASFLMSLTVARRGPARIELPYEKLLIANRLGMKPESFSRALRQLRGVGVFVEREFVRIDDVGRLSGFVEGGEPDGIPCPMIRTPAQCSSFGTGCIEAAYRAPLRAPRRPRA
ncbi:MAG: Crp/Fnr family transcriptional regulator [Xanthobacteraceae bacterium]